MLRHAESGYVTYGVRVFSTLHFVLCNSLALHREARSTRLQSEAFESTKSCSHALIIRDEDHSAVER
jgi:hypothetical protein